MTGPMFRPRRYARFAIGTRVITREHGAGVVLHPFVGHPDFEFGGYIVALDDTGTRRVFRSDELALEPPDADQLTIDKEDE